MKNVIVSITFLYFFLDAFTQKTPDSEIPLKFIKSVINLEGKSEHYNKKTAEYKNSMFDSSFSKIYQKMVDTFYSFDFRATGTAVFIKYKSKRYLITARHVLLDKLSVFGENETYRFVMRVPLENETNKIKEEILPFSASWDTTKIYELSSSKEDLAIIALDSYYPEYDYSKFANYLELKGHIPLSINDIDTTCNLDYGQNLICIGYPMYSRSQKRNLTPKDATFKPNFTYNIAVSYGKVSIPSTQEYYFIGDMSIAPGNSGGPVFSNNKLVGIISSQAYLFLEDTKGNAYPFVYRMPYPYVIKSSLIMPLLHTLRKRLKEE